MNIPFYEYYEQTLAAGERYVMNSPGNFLTMISTTGSSDILISIAERPEQKFPAGLSLELPPGQDFSKVAFRNTEGGSVTIKFAICTGRVHDARLTLTGSIFTDINTNLTSILAESQGDTTPENWGLVQCSSAAQGTQVLASNTSRKSAFIQNLPTNTGAMYVGFDTTLDSATPKYAAVLLPGQSWSCDDYRGIIRVQAAINNERVAYSEV